MATLDFSRNKNLKISFLLTTVLIGSLLIGVLSGLFSPLGVLAAIAALIAIYILIKRPELGLLGYLVITSTIIDGNLLPRFSIGVGRLLITDIILLTLLGLIIGRKLLIRDFRIIHTPLDLPLIGFVGIALVSSLVAIGQTRLTLNDSLGEIRTIMSYLTFFAVTNLIREKRRLYELLRGLLVFGTVVALAMAAQYVLGNRVQILPGRIETLGTEGVTFMGVTRIIPPGESLVFVGFMTMTVIMAVHRSQLKNIWPFLVWGLTGLGVVLTFKRNLWIAAFLAILLLALVSGPRIRLKIAGWILMVMAAATILLFPILSLPGSQPTGLLTGAFDRLTSLANPQTFEDPNSSLRWRDFEYQYSMPQIAAHPLIGLGMGAMYRPFVVGKDWEGFDGRRFIHNGHLSIVVKAGLLGYLGFVIVSLVALVRGFKFWRRIPDLQLQAVLLGFTLAYLGILIGSSVSPMIVSGWWTPVIGILLGTNEVVLKGSIKGFYR